MEKLTLKTKEIMNERFGKDNIISLATVKDGKPYVRNVDGFYDDGVFYVITYALSNKMKQIKENSHVAILGDWFTAHGLITDTTILMMKILVFFVSGLRTVFYLQMEQDMI